MFMLLASLLIHSFLEYLPPNAMDTMDTSKYSKLYHTKTYTNTETPPFYVAGSLRMKITGLIYD